MATTTPSEPSCLPDQHFEFRRLLLDWHTSIDRELPWKKGKDPYRIWISEIILQQTQVVVGKSYYENFIHCFPTLRDLASADETQVLSAWKGLGYYSRARNMHKAARIIRDQFKGVFPTTYRELITLPGIGPYTAAAIASFAFDLPHAVIDGNVIRILSRVHGIQEEINSSKGKKTIRILSDQHFDTENSAEYNQSIMDFGALICSPKPKCSICPMDNLCFAFNNNYQSQFPVKRKSKERTRRRFHYFIVKSGDSIAFKKRVKRDIWQGLYEFPMVETNDEVLLNTSQKMVEEETGMVLKWNEPVVRMRQILSHQEIEGVFYLAQKISSGQNIIWVETEQLATLPIPRLIEGFINQVLN